MSVDSYIANRAAFVRVDQQVDALAKQISQVGMALTNSRSVFSFSNTGVGMPAEVTFRANSMNGDDWRSAKQIMELLAQWHQARNAVRDDWANLSQDQRSALQPPPPAAAR